MYKHSVQILGLSDIAHYMRIVTGMDHAWLTHLQLTYAGRAAYGCCIFVHKASCMLWYHVQAAQTVQANLC